MTAIAEASRLYQTALEYVRTSTDHGVHEPDDDTELADATQAVEVAWLEHRVGA